VSFSVGVGLTNDCNLACAHCYRDTNRIDTLALEDIRVLCDSIPVRAINLGTGENALHPEFRQILAFLNQKGIRTTITSNGYSIASLSDDEIRFFQDVEFSLDFPTESEQDQFRGKGNWRLILAQLERCRRLGINVTITAVMMSINYDKLPRLAQVAADNGATLRVNVYQPVKSDAFTLSYEQFWEGFQILFAQTEVIACNEPIVRAIMGLGGSRCGCGTGTIRVSPRGEILPCVYWPEKNLALSDLQSYGPGITETEPFRRARILPEFCRTCEFADTCGGGCPGRRMLRGRLDQADEYCPFARGDNIKLKYHMGASRDMPKAASACTTIVSGQSPAARTPK
jgi:radical SAM protein with 4Fe4S-binding SPASM domain